MVLDIQITKTAEEPGAASLAVTVPAENVQVAEEKATQAWQARVRLPGFRKGKAPAAVVRKKFAEEIRQQVLEELVRESWSRALAQESLKPIAEPHIHDLKWEQGAPITFQFHVEVKPDLRLARLGGFRLQASNGWVDGVAALPHEPSAREWRVKPAQNTPTAPS